ncbi:unnamed protein product [Lampetra fluviatilis]
MLDSVPDDTRVTTRTHVAQPYTRADGESIALRGPASKETALSLPEVARTSGETAAALAAVAAVKLAPSRTAQRVAAKSHTFTDGVASSASVRDGAERFANAESLVRRACEAPALALILLAEMRRFTTDDPRLINFAFRVAPPCFAAHGPHLFRRLDTSCPPHAVGSSVRCRRGCPTTRGRRRHVPAPPPPAPTRGSGPQLLGPPPSLAFDGTAHNGAGGGVRGAGTGRCHRGGACGVRSGQRTLPPSAPTSDRESTPLVLRPLSR